MATSTPNYALVKPAYNEWADITVLNNNLDIIDTQIFAKASKTRQIIAGLGLTGGGDLTTDRTLNIVSANAGIVVNSDNIELKPATTSIIGGVKIGADMTVSADGTINPLLNQTTADGRYVNIDGDTSTGAQRIRQKAGVYNETGFYIDATNADYPRLEIFKHEPTAGQPDFYIRRRTSNLTFLDLIKCTHDGLVSYAGGNYGTINGTTATFSGNVTAPNLAYDTTQIIAGTGLVGGGDLTTDRTLNIASANDGIVVNADNIELKPATTSVIGGVKIGTDMTVSADGTINPLLNQTTADGRYVNIDGDTSTGAQRIRQKAGVYNETGFYIDATNAEYPTLEIFKHEPTAGQPDFYIRRRTSELTFLDLIKCTHAGLVSYAGGTFNGDITAPNIITNTSIGTCTTLFSGTQQCGQATWKDTGIDIPTTYSSVLIGVNIASSGLYDTESEFSRCTLTRGQTLLFAHQTQDECIMGKIIGNRLWTYATGIVNMSDNSLKTVIGITRR